MFWLGHCYIPIIRSKLPSFTPDATVTSLAPERFMSEGREDISNDSSKHRAWIFLRTTFRLVEVCSVGLGNRDGKSQTEDHCISRTTDITSLMSDAVGRIRPRGQVLRAELKGDTRKDNEANNAAALSFKMFRVVLCLFILTSGRAGVGDGGEWDLQSAR